MAADRATHAARAAQVALVGAILVTIVGYALASAWVHATTPMQQIIIGVLLWPALLINPSTATSAAVVCFVLQFVLLWLLAFAALRYGTRSRRHKKEDERNDIDKVLRTVATKTGGTLHKYPMPNQLERRVVLRDSREQNDLQFEQAGVDSDGALWVLGHDQGPRVSSFLGTTITSYEWVYVVAPECVNNLIAALGGTPGDDVLGLLADYHTKNRGRLDGLLRSPQVAAQFDNWHS